MTEHWSISEINNAKLLTSSSKSKNTEGYIKINAHNSYQHEKAKFEKCYNLALMKRKFYVEAEFSQGGRADIFNISDGIIIELLESEKLSYAKEKVKKYPKDIEVHFWKVRGDGTLARLE